MDDRTTSHPDETPSSTSSTPGPSGPAAASAPATPRGPRRRRRHGFLAGLVLGALGAGLVGFAVGAATPAAEAGLGAAHGFGHDGPASIERAREHAGWFVSFAMYRLDGTDDQEENVQRIVSGAIDELAPLVKRHHTNRDRLRELLTAPEIDRDAVETLRRDTLVLADDFSRVVAGALADGAEVLTVSQRDEVAGHLARFHRHH